MARLFFFFTIIATTITLSFIPQPHLFPKASRDGTQVSLPATVPNTRSQERDAIVTAEARRAGVPAGLAVAVSHIEDTSGDSLALSNRGAVGIMQVLPTYWLDAFRDECYGDRSLFDRARNACVGVHVLKLYHARYGTWTRTFCAYHGSSGDVCQKYTESILSSL